VTFPKAESNKCSIRMYVPAIPRPRQVGVSAG
jgi:hypothetical protein